MKILFLSTRVPHAGITGGHILVYQRIARLAARGHDVGLAAFEGKEGSGPPAEIGARLRELEIVPHPPRRSAAGDMWSVATRGIPPYFRRYRSPEMMRRVGDMVERSRYDVVIAEYAAMGQYLHRNPYLPAVRRIVSCHSSVAASYRKLADVMKYSARGIRSRFSIGSLMRYETEMYRGMDRILVLTAQERYGLLGSAPDLRISVIPAGVDTTHFAFRESSPAGPLVLFTGHFEQQANRDGILWFLKTAWPRLKAQVPGLRLRVVGPHSDSLLRRHARRDPAVSATGEVPDIRPHLADATVFVCPVRLGSGLRLKVLEAMSAGVPVVTTSLGAEGIAVQQGDNGFVADRPELMAEYTALLLADETLRNSIAARARVLMETRFSWDRGVEQMEEIMRDISAGKAARLHI